MVFTLLAMVLLSGIFISQILRSLERTLPTTLLGQLEYLNRITDGLGETASAAALATQRPTSRSVPELVARVDEISAQVVAMRDTFVFDNLVQSSAYHSAVAPSLVDVRQWLTQGVSGLPPDSPLTMRIVYARLLETYRKASALRDESHAAAQNILQHQRSRLETFIGWVNALLVLALALSVTALVLMFRHQRLMRRESAARAEREFLVTILESTSDFVCTARPDGRLTFVNQAARRLLGLENGDSLDGHDISDLHLARSMRTIETEGQPAAASGVWEGENAVRRRDGSVIPVSQVIVAHASPEAYRGYVSTIMRDITERKLAESSMADALEALREAKAGADAANRAKSEFLANMSHEIRTPVNGIMGMLQLLESMPLDDEQSVCASTAMGSCTRLVRLLSDILDLSRIEAGKLSVQHAPMGMRDVFCQVGELFMPSARESGTELCFDIDPAIPERVLGDAARLQQVLINMVGNALKFTPGGQVTVGAWGLAPLRDRYARVFFEVADTGAGIPDDKLGLLFTPFSQVDAGYTRTHQGAGLGLSICKRLVELMGGSISVISEVGVGTSMAFTLDFAVDAGLRPMAKTDHTDPITALDGRKVLMVEDDAVSALAAASMLRKFGADVTHVGDGRSALDALGRDTYDLVLMDMQMPVMDGLEATRAIRDGRAGQRSRSVPVVAMTAYAMAGDRERFLASGMSAYVSKPVGMDELLRVIGDVLTR